MERRNPYEKFVKEFDTSSGQCLRYFDLHSIGGDKFGALPFSVRVLLESAVRNCDEFQVKTSHVEEILNWAESKDRQVEIPFCPARVILQDFTGVPAVVDFAAMRDAVAALGGDPSKINPVCPADLVVDHSVQADVVKRSSLSVCLSVYLSVNL
jgi:aconitate hydratase